MIEEEVEGNTCPEHVLEKPCHILIFLAVPEFHTLCDVELARIEVQENL